MGVIGETPLQRGYSSEERPQTRDLWTRDSGRLCRQAKSVRGHSGRTPSLGSRRNSPSSKWSISGRRAGFTPHGRKIFPKSATACPSMSAPSPLSLSALARMNSKHSTTRVCIAVRRCVTRRNPVNPSNAPIMAGNGRWMARYAESPGTGISLASTKQMLLCQR